MTTYLYEAIDGSGTAELVVPPDYRAPAHLEIPLLSTVGSGYELFKLVGEKRSTPQEVPERAQPVMDALEQGPCDWGQLSRAHKREMLHFTTIAWLEQGGFIERVNPDEEEFRRVQWRKVER